jgi:PAS domain S-box-containing protein
MHVGIARDPATMVAALTRAAAAGEDSFGEALEQVPVAAYRTDRDGTVTHYNRACISLAGREPTPFRDRWCVTWKLYTEDGSFLPHDQCPMAVALRENREVRGAKAVAERPDGRRVPFAPYPTPLRNEQGELVGAINVLVDLSDPTHQQFCREQSARCRRLAAAIDQKEAKAALLALAAEYEGQLAIAGNA